MRRQRVSSVHFLLSLSSLLRNAVLLFKGGSSLWMGFGETFQQAALRTTGGNSAVFSASDADAADRVTDSFTIQTQVTSGGKNCIVFHNLLSKHSLGRGQRTQNFSLHLN